jgi:WD40-like Beta Propeller Repeat
VASLGRSYLRVLILLAVLRTGVALLALVVVGGCGSSTASNESGPAVQRNLVYEKVIGEKGIWIADVDGSNARKLVDGGYVPVISPDGKRVAYLDEPVGSLYVIETEGGDPKLLARGTYRKPAWSPDSERVATELFTERRGGAGLVSFDAETGNRTTIMRGGNPWGWSFSPDGKRVVFGMSHGSNPKRFNTTNIDLFVTTRDGGETKRITDTGDAGFPVWGSNGIAFAKLIPHKGWGRHEVWQIQPDGSERRTITGPLPDDMVMQGCVGLGPVDWSEDGHALLGGWACEFSLEPIAIDPESGEFRALGGGAYAADLSQDGRFALVDGAGGAEPPREEQNVIVVPYGGGKPTIVARGAVAPSWNR